MSVTLVALLQGEPITRWARDDDLIPLAGGSIFGQTT
jgi:hypothetical protein